MSAMFSTYEAIKTHFNNLGIPVNNASYQNPTDVYNIANRVKMDLTVEDVRPLQDNANRQEYEAEFTFFMYAGDYVQEDSTTIKAGCIVDSLFSFVNSEAFKRCQDWGAEDVEHIESAIQFDGIDSPVVAYAYLTLAFRFCDNYADITFNPEAL